jgi:uncharacterized membrane protein
MTTQEEIFEQAAVARPRFQLNLRTLSLILVVVGLLVSGYLSYVKLTEVPMVCVGGGVFNCEVVQNSVYSRLLGIPIAWMGFAVYIILGAILVLEDRVAFLREYGITLFFGINLFAWLYSMWLVYVQFVLLQALCQWCLTHEAIITFLFLVSIIRLKRTLSPDLPQQLEELDDPV